MDIGVLSIHSRTEGEIFHFTFGETGGKEISARYHTGDTLDPRRSELDIETDHIRRSK
jgi:hypothetical protein